MGIPDKLARAVEGLVEALMVAKRFYTFCHLRRACRQAKSRQFGRGYVLHFVNELSEEGLAVVRAACLEVAKVLGCEDDAGAELAALQQELAQDVELIPHNVVGLVYQQVGIDRSQLWVLTKERKLGRPEHVFGEHVQHDCDEHVLAVVVLPQSVQCDDHDAIEEAIERHRLGLVHLEYLHVQHVSNDGHWGVGLPVDDVVVGSVNLAQSRRNAGRGGIISLLYGALQLVTLDRANPRVDLAKNVGGEPEPIELRRRHVAARARIKQVERNAMWTNNTRAGRRHIRQARKGRSLRIADRIADACAAVTGTVARWRWSRRDAWAPDASHGCRRSLNPAHLVR